MVRDCQQCNGKGYHYATMRDLEGRRPHGLGIDAIVHCDFPTCRNGKVTPEAQAEYYDKLQSWGRPGGYTKE